LKTNHKQIGIHEKYNKDDDLQKYKAKLVARGFSQIPGMDYDQTSTLS
jgi:hypothetical protein